MISASSSDPWERDLPPDPQRAPWQPSDGLRSAYRDRLRHLDEGFVTIAERIATWSLGLVADPPAAEPSLDDLARLSDQAASLEDDAFAMMAREAPVGGDLRATVAVIRSTYDLLRAGRLVRHIGDGLESLAPYASELGDVREGTLVELRAVAVEVFTGGVAAWRDRDVLAIGELRSLDEQVGALRDRLVDELPRDLPPEGTVAYVLLCRYLERLGDHGVNLAAQLVWSVTGDRVVGHSALGGPSH